MQSYIVPPQRPRTPGPPAWSCDASTTYFSDGHAQADTPRHRRHPALGSLGSLGSLSDVGDLDALDALAAAAACTLDSIPLGGAPPPVTARLRERLLDALGPPTRACASYRVHDVMRILRAHGDMVLPASSHLTDPCQCAALVSTFMDDTSWPTMIVNSADYVVCKLLDATVPRKPSADRLAAVDVITDIVGVVAHAFSALPACRALMFNDFDASAMRAALAPLTKRFTCAGLALMYVGRELSRLPAPPEARPRFYSAA